MYIQSNQQISPIAHKHIFSTNTAPRKISSYQLLMIADLLDISLKDAEKKAYDMNRKQYPFLYNLINRYNEMYHYESKKEDPQILFDIANTIKKPDKMHNKLLNGFSGSFKAIAEILNLSKNEKDIDFSTSFSNKVFHDESFAENILIDILKSPFKDEYINNIDKYKQYLRDNRKNPQVIKQLDEMLANNNFDNNLYEKTKMIHKLKNRLAGKELLPENVIQQQYSKDGIKFLLTVAKYTNSAKIHTPEDNPALLSIYQTTTKENVNIRRSIIKNYSQNTLNNAANYREELNELNSIFGKIDNDKYAKKFIIEFMKTDTNIETFKELNHILDTIPSVKAYVFHKNLTKIIANTMPGEKRDKVLADKISDTDYIERLRLKDRGIALKYGYIKKSSPFATFRDSVENQINRFRYLILSLQHEKTPNSVVKPVNEFVQNEQFVPNIESVVAPEVKEQVLPKIENAVVQEVKEQILPKIENTGVQEVEEQIATNIESVVAPEAKEQVLPVINFVNKTLKQSKIELRESVVKLIKEKLHAKTVEKQEGLYSENATKMRLKLLPEIFASIKETRAIDRAVGKKKSYSANKDAVDLYSRINGQNRKLIRYMLMKRNIDGTRMFEVKDIIAFIDKANSQVKKAKDKNPKLMAKDIKGYFEHLYQAKLEQYGKLTRLPKSKKSQKA